MCVCVTLIVAAVIGEGCSGFGGGLDFTPRKFPLVSLGKQLLGRVQAVLTTGA